MDIEALAAFVSKLETWRYILGVPAALFGLATILVQVWHWQMNLRLSALKDAASERAGVIASAAVASAHAEAASARAEAATAQQQAVEANARAEEASQKAEEERRARVKIEQQLAPRSLSADQVVEIASRVAPFRGTEIQVVSSPDAEPARLAQAVLAAIRAAGWSVAYQSGHDSDRSVPNILVELRDGADRAAVNAANALVLALRSDGLAVAGPTAWQAKAMTGTFVAYGSPLPNAPIRLTIGTK
jgi:ribosomal protein L12E/L44/L45/RPP1/RPP2